MPLKTKPKRLQVTRIIRAFLYCIKAMTAQFMSLLQIKIVSLKTIFEYCHWQCGL